MSSTEQILANLEEAMLAVPAEWQRKEARLRIVLETLLSRDGVVAEMCMQRLLLKRSLGRSRGPVVVICGLKHEATEWAITQGCYGNWRWVSHADGLRGIGDFTYAMVEPLPREKDMQDINALLQVRGHAW